MSSVAAFKWLDGTKYSIVKDDEQDPARSEAGAKYVAVSWRQGSPQAIAAHATARFVVFGDPVSRLLFVYELATNAVAAARAHSLDGGSGAFALMAEDEVGGKGEEVGLLIHSEVAVEGKDKASVFTYRYDPKPNELRLIKLWTPKPE